VTECEVVLFGCTDFICVDKELTDIAYYINVTKCSVQHTCLIAVVAL
jgi:hypothetical protein